MAGKRGKGPVEVAASGEGSVWEGRAFWLLAAGVVGLFLFLQVLRSAEPLALDQGLFACFGRWILDGWLPYRDMWDQKPPALLHTYALAFALFGVRVGAVWALEGIWLALESLLAFLLARRLWGRWAGLFAALFLFTGLWAPQWQGYWSRAQGELWLALPVLGAAWFALEARERPFAAFWAGCLMGLAGMYKMPALALAAAWPWCWIPGGRLGGWVRRGLWLSAGVLVPWALAFGYFAARGGAGEFYEAVFVFPRIFHAVTGEFRHWSHVIEWVPIGVAMGVPTALLAALVGLGRLALRRDRLLLWLAPWLVLPVVVVIIQGQMANYHYLLTIPSIAVAGGCGVALLVSSLQARGAAWRRWAAAGALVALLVSGGTELQRWMSFYDADAGYVFGDLDRHNYLVRMRQGSFLPSVEDEMARYVDAHSGKGEGLLVWGLGPGIYFLADRHPVTRYPFHHMFLTGERLSVAIPGLEGRQRTFLERIERDPPALILVGRGDVNPFEREDSYAQMVKFDAFRRFVAEHYTLAKEFPRYIVYRRRSPADGAAMHGAPGEQ